MVFPVSLPPAFAPCPVREGPEALQSLFLPLAWLWSGTDFPFLFPIIFPLALPYLPAVPLLTVPGWWQGGFWWLGPANLCWTRERTSMGGDCNKLFVRVTLEKISSAEISLQCLNIVSKQ